MISKSLNAGIPSLLINLFDSLFLLDKSKSIIRLALENVIGKIDGVKKINLLTKLDIFPNAHMITSGGIGRFLSGSSPTQETKEIRLNKFNEIILDLCDAHCE